MIKNLKLKISLTNLVLFSFCIPASLYAQKSNFPYELSTLKEGLLLTAGLSLESWGFLLKKDQHKPNYDEISMLDKNDINPFDRPAADLWSPKARLTSDIGLAILEMSPAFLILQERIRYNIFTTYIMYLEGWVLNDGLTGISKGLANRKRPYLYNKSLSPEEKSEKGNDAVRSFYSGHTSHSFYSAVFVSKIFSDTNPLSNYRYIVWGSTLAIAGTVAYMRYRSGMHFPSDIAAGALTGAAIGYIIPVAHSRNSGRYALIPLIGHYSGLMVKINFN